ASLAPSQHLHPPQLRSSRRKPRGTERGPSMPACARMNGMERRAFIAALAAAAPWPRVARAPQMPVIGFLDPRSADAISERLRAFRQGLKETGYVEGENVAIVYRFAENQNDRLPELAADLVRRQVAVIATAGDDVVAPV